ncbi:hypothetical protein KC19_2G179500 [Ceratodon purpureus]|uniref:Uncharacterized protein n=1 Tax=Ceratodon purpureus TaxID=3225 RepID=A0A8T0IXK1_CERPU|nr:hypothetical protein KC19_2G179500 [Ceratodon purpureus]
MDSAFGGNSEGSFEPDDFYESFLAPKFHDFTAPEEPIDPDAFFMAQPGMLKKAFSTIEEVKTTAPKVYKVSPLEAHKTVTAYHQQAPPKSPIAVERAAVSASSAKKASRVVSTSLSPLTFKSLKNGISATNSPALPPHLEKNSNGSLKPTSLAKKLQASENDDPNSPTNNSSDVVVPKPVKPALNRQRSVKAHEEKKPTLTCQRSQKVHETKQAAVAVDAPAVRKASGEYNVSKDISEEESDAGKAPGTPQRIENPTKPVATTGAAKAVISAMTGCKMPLKDPTPNHQESKKPVTCTDVAGSPYSGHLCKSSRCAVNDPNFSSPVHTMKYLIAKRGTPGSLRKAIPNYIGGEKGSEDASSNETLNDNERKISDIISVEGVQIDASKVKANTKLALEDVFQKMSLDQSLGVVVKEKVTTQATVTAVTELSKSEVEDLQEVQLKEDQSVVAPEQVISAGEVRAWAGRLLIFEEKAASRSGNINLNQLEYPQNKHGKKRKSGELMPGGAAKRANRTSDNIRDKAISTKSSQVKEAAASKVLNKPPMRRFSVVKRLSIARTSSRVTCPRPFRLRTQERGAVKEKEFIKKVKDYKAAKEGFYSAFQGLAVAEPKIPGKFLKSGHVFSAKQADLNLKDDKEAALKLMKPGISPAKKAPQFNHPFKPHRSTKKLTVPQEPKFLPVRGSRTCPSHTATVPAA